VGHVFPDMRGKSVLEIGSSCGFWSFKFAELGDAAGDRSSLPNGKWQGKNCSLAWDYRR
jgi:hypothetical protein